MFIKSITMAIPIYNMHFVKLPQTLHEKLDARIRNFWLSMRNDFTRPLCLYSWDEICKPKADGNLGLRRKR